MAPTARSSVSGITASVTVSTNTFATKGVNALAISRSAPTAPSRATNAPAASRPPVIAARLWCPSAITTVTAARYAAAGPSYMGSRNPNTTCSSVAIPRLNSDAATSVGTSDGATPATDPATSQNPIPAGTTASIQRIAAIASRLQPDRLATGGAGPGRGAEI